MDTLYEHIYYQMRETKKPTYLDFYELEENDLKKLLFYENQTVRYKDKWFFIEKKKKYFYSSSERDSAPKNTIKYLYKRGNLSTTPTGNGGNKWRVGK